MVPFTATISADSSVSPDATAELPVVAQAAAATDVPDVLMMDNDFGHLDAVKAAQSQYEEAEAHSGEDQEANTRDLGMAPQQSEVHFHVQTAWSAFVSALAADDVASASSILFGPEAATLMAPGAGSVTLATEQEKENLLNVAMATVTIPAAKASLAPVARSENKSAGAAKSVLGIILGGGAGTRLYPLTKKRAKPAVPLGANYRLIDIPGTADAVRQYLWQLEEQNVQESKADSTSPSPFPPLPLPLNTAPLSPPPPLSPSPPARPPLLPSLSALAPPPVDTTILGLDAERAKEMPYIASMGIYVISKDAMIRMLADDFPDANDFGSEVIPGACAKGAKVQAFLYDGYWEDIGTIEAFYNANPDSRLTQLHSLYCHVSLLPYHHHQVQAFLYDGYWEDIGTIEAFYNANLATTQPNSPFSFYDRSAPIYTQARYLPPSKLQSVDISESVIGEGCVIEDSQLHHSVIGLRAKIGAGSVIKDTLVMGADYYETEEQQEALIASGGVPIGIGKNVVIHKAIIDKNARIGDNVQIINKDQVEEAARETDGYFIKSGIVTVIKDAVIPPGTII
ncbi:unnamed protein product [Closterium sp. Naga37s-1]|nr:unnamed protein product [Closterium sp. Naga37s-1]